MGKQRRDRRQGQAIPLGWGEDSDPSAAPSSRRPAPRAPADSVPDLAPGLADTPSTAGPTAPPAPRDGLPPRARRVLGAGAALLLVVALAVGLPRLLSTTSDPQRVAQDFLQALVDGDADQLREHVVAAPDASGAALTAQILQSATDRIQSFEIDDVEVAEGTATVTATLDNGEEALETTLTLTPESGSAFTPATWMLEPVEVPEFLVDLPLGVEDVLINGISIPVRDLLVLPDSFTPQIAIQLLPGTYEISVPEDGPWQSAKQLTLEAPPVLGTWRKPVGDLWYDLSDAGHEEVRNQVAEALEHCTSSTSPAPDGCPFALPDVSADDAAEPSRQGTWELLDEPVVEARSGDAFMWSVMSTSSGIAEFTPKGAPDRDGEPAGQAGLEKQRVPVDINAIAYVDPAGELAVDVESGFSYTFCMDAETGEVTGLMLTSDVDTGNTCG